MSDVTILLNGSKHDLDSGMTIGQLLQQLQLQPEQVVLELNRTILSNAEDADTILRAGDCLEIIQFVGGG